MLHLLNNLDLFKLTPEQQQVVVLKFISGMTTDEIAGQLCKSPGAVRALRTGRAQAPAIEIKQGPFQGTRESLRSYRIPEWFRDAKFGIWAHWGPQAVPMMGDWYARHMYVQGHVQYKHHLETYGHPSTNGYKDIIPLWKAEKWDPDRLIAEVRRVCRRGGDILIVNHFSGVRLARPIERALRPLAAKIGFRPEFSFERYVAAQDWTVLSSKSTNLFGLSKLVHVRND